MRNTRYYQKKNDGVFFARCPKDDQDASVDDGRKMRDWTYGTDTGQTLGYSQETINGYIESMFINKTKDGTRMFCVGLQTADGVDVFQCELKNNFLALNDDVVAFALRHDKIDLEFPVSLSIYVGKPNKSGFKRAYLNLGQLGGPIWPSYKRDKENPFHYEGVPDVEKKESMGDVKYDSTLRDEFLYEKLEELMKDVAKRGQESKREETPAESKKEEEDSDVPF